MRHFRWLSDSYRRLSARERKVVLGGAVVSAAALLVALWIIPFVRSWREREADVAVRAEQVARLEALAAREAQLRTTVGQGTQTDARRSLLTGNTPAVAASELQLVLKRYADQSQVLLERVDVVGQVPPAVDDLSPVPVQLFAQGDLRGLVDLLFYLQNGRELVVVDEVRVWTPPARGGGSGVERLTWSIRLHGFFARDPEGGGES